MGSDGKPGKAVVTPNTQGAGKGEVRLVKKGGGQGEE